MPTRRTTLISGLISGLIAGVSLSLSAMIRPARATVIDRALVRRRDVTVGLRRWPATASPMRVAVLADLHVCRPYVTPEQVALIVADIADQRPDLVLLPGDFLSERLAFGTPCPIEEVADALAGLAAAAPCFTVRGNHDLSIPRARFVQALARVGITTLAPDAVLPWGEGRVRLVGMGWTGPEVKSGIAAALADFSGPTIALAHTPNVILARGFSTGQAGGRPDGMPVDLVVAGHTHGGQIRLPLMGPVITGCDLPGAMVRGLTPWRGGSVYVSAGIGMSGLPLRIDCPAEWTMLQLSGPDARPAPDQGA